MPILVGMQWVEQRFCASHDHVLTMLSAPLEGYRVGRVDPCLTASGGSSRELVRVYTEGTLFEPELMPEGGATRAGMAVGRLLAIAEEALPDGGVRRGVCSLDSASCEISYGLLLDDERATHLGA